MYITQSHYNPNLKISQSKETGDTMAKILICASEMQEKPHVLVIAPEEYEYIVEKGDYVRTTCNGLQQVKFAFFENDQECVDALAEILRNEDEITEVYHKVAGI